MNSISDNHILVALGASAGGLEALNSFFYNVPEDSDYTYLIVQHLSSDHKSLMAELLAKKTKIPVTEIQQNTEIERNHIYVIPPSKNLVIENKHLKLLDKPKGQQLNLPIDILFESLAKEYRQSAVGVILSGTGSDGSRGIRYIKEEGGLVLVQHPEDSKFGGMPQSAINTGFPDFVVPVEDMSNEITSYFDSSNILSITQDFTNIDDSALRDILSLLKSKTEIDFNLYKRPTLLRRIIRRMRIHQLESLREYYKHLKNSKDEVDIIYKEFLIGVTKFFRDEEMWRLLENNVIPKLVADKQDNDILKIWDVACSTGEETYSLAILFLEEIAKQKKNIELKIFATDISQFHLDIASKGEYSKSTLVNVDPEYLARYFKKDDDTFKIAESVRRTAIFSNHNILKDPPFNKVDMVMCRNLLIYFQNDVQQKVFNVLHFSLKLEGYLVLGSSESLGDERDNFDTISRKWKIFKNIKASRGLRTETLHASSDRKFRNKRRTNPDIVANSNMKQRKIEELLSSSILEQFNATSIYIDEDYNILEARGNFRKFANLPNSGFTTNLLKMLPEEFKIPLTTSIKRSKRLKDSQVISERIIFVNDDGQTAVDLRVLPILDDNSNKVTEFVVSLMDQNIESVNETVIERTSISESATLRIKDLEEEIDLVQDELNKAIEDTEISNDKLLATNEELLASNEELQCTNEELQSVNEELNTINTDHIQKLDELSALNEDINNLLTSTNLGVIFLDDKLRVRKFTPAIKEHFDLYQADLGRHIDNFVVSFGENNTNNIVTNAERVINTGKVFEKKIISKNNRHFLQRISPYITTAGEINGAVVTFIDIERIHKSQEELRRSQIKFKDFYENDPVMHASISPDSGNIVDCNKIFYKTLGFKNKKEILNKSIFHFYNDQSKIKASDLITEIKNTGQIQNEDMTLVAIDGREIHVLLNSKLTKNIHGETITMGTLIDITALKETADKLAKRQLDLEMANNDLEQFVSICSHDLKEPLATIRFGSEMLDKNFSHQLESKGKEYIRYIHEAAGRLANQINALLEHSRIGQNSEKQDVDLKQVLDTVVMDLAKSINDCKAKISIGKLPTIKGYEVELRLLFQNLLSNALKYCKKGVTPDIRISYFKDNDYYIFSVNDNGIGIEEIDLENIFKIFNKIHRNDNIEGTGIGLAHCDKIVKLHDGKIWVDSQPGVGSTFHFKLKA